MSRRKVDPLGEWDPLAVDPRQIPIPGTEPPAPGEPTSAAPPSSSSTTAPDLAGPQGEPVKPTGKKRGRKPARLVNALAVAEALTNMHNAGEPAPNKGRVKMETVSLAPPVMTRTEAAAYLGVSIPTLWRLAKEGKIAHVMIGERARYQREDLDAYITGTRSTTWTPKPKEKKADVKN
jgi:excisionase family DNA binding protein